MTAQTFVVVSQVYPPDPAAAGQHVADAATELARRGHRVVVLTADRGYDDPAQVFPKREHLHGVDVRRIPFSSFGKRSMASRLLGGLLFTMQAVLRGLFLRRADAVITTTSPPVGTAAALALSYLLRAPLKFWAMDINPDQLIALGFVERGAPAARAVDAYNRRLLGRADQIIVLDRYMAQTVSAKVRGTARLAVVPPWAHVEPEQPVPHEGNPFRLRHGLTGKTVIMHSGNHGPSNPLRTILDAAEQLVDDPDLVFVFVGGGIGKREIEERRLPNVMSLPYQPAAVLAHSLSAADVHVVTLGADVVGVVHPCKVYGAMAVSRPVLFVGPRRSHVGDLLRKADFGWQVEHGDTAGAVAILREIRTTGPEALRARGLAARALIDREYARARTCGMLCDLMEAPATSATPPVPVDSRWQTT